jgi:hypothetical protein
MLIHGCLGLIQLMLREVKKFQKSNWRRGKGGVNLLARRTFTFTPSLLSSVETLSE